MEIENISEINRIAESLRWKLIGYLEAENLILKKYTMQDFLSTLYNDFHKNDLRFEFD